VEGSLQTRSYDAQDGTKRYVTEVIADGVEFLSSPAASADPGPTPPPERRELKGEQMSMHNSGFTEVDDDELPF
jgi:single-strand DNA-binding protein